MTMQDSLGICIANAVGAAYGFDTKQPGSQGRLLLSLLQHKSTTLQDSGASLRDTVKVLNCKVVYKEYYWPYEVNKTAAEGNNLCKNKYELSCSRFKAC